MTVAYHANDADYQYNKLMNTLLFAGDYKEGRNGGTYGLFGNQMKFDLSKGFPLLTTKKVHFHAVVTELLWFLKGDTNVKYLHDHNVTIWDEWADEKGNLGPVYGSQWRSWFAPSMGEAFYIDQIANVIKSIKEDPFSRRHIVTAWNPAEIAQMALPPCHLLFQFHVSSDRKLSCHLYQRSADWFLGVPFNIASYALLTFLIAQQTGYEVGTFTHSFGDYHLYENHVEQAKIQLERVSYPLPKLYVAPKNIFDLTPNDISVINYRSHPTIKAPVSK